ncbi:MULTISPECIES: CDP-diacylglycerol diphosphatase [Dickeya]|uniref:CDP-diacylglycerol diphosphatase n=1 Tax=Dickeya TaxID=204037 RepID=UPI0020471C33|nr:MULTISPECIES: CDP-diacylglycerol diphosphatase [Dickeya]MCO7255116.1 CDP-diacylglycerol diphosphatase [Dickeya oryzae]UPT56481.1 CDP-diacylglycerol diphosphatase [Dickeya zeae]
MTRNVMIRKKYLIGLIVTLLLVALLLYFWQPFARRGNGNALWQFVSQQCVPNQQNNHSPAPCLDVNLQGHYALFKDRRGPYHNLLIPTDRISGIESPLLLQPGTPAWFAAAWSYRDRLSSQMGKPISDDKLGLAINSLYGRTQGQLHIHISCLKPEVYQTLRTQNAHIGYDWVALGQPLLEHDYLATKLNGSDLTRSDPFKLLNQYVQARGDNMENYGLALTANAQGELILLAVRRDFIGLFNRGSAEEILDVSCALAQ